MTDLALLFLPLLVIMLRWVTKMQHTMGIILQKCKKIANLFHFEWYWGYPYIPIKDSLQRGPQFLSSPAPSECCRQTGGRRQHSRRQRRAGRSVMRSGIFVLRGHCLGSGPGNAATRACNHALLEHVKLVLPLVRYHMSQSLKNVLECCMYTYLQYSHDLYTFRIHVNRAPTFYFIFHFVLTRFSCELLLITKARCLVARRGRNKTCYCTFFAHFIFYITSTLQVTVYCSLLHSSHLS